MKDFFAFFPLRSMKMNGGGKLFMQFQRTAISSRVGADRKAISGILLRFSGGQSNNFGRKMEERRL